MSDLTLISGATESSEHWLVASTLIGAVVGFSLARANSWLERRSRVAAHKKALKAEVDLCAGRASTYRNPKEGEPLVKSPAYRCPTHAFAAAFPWLLQDGALPPDQVTTIEEFYAEVADFNRCLDYCHDARYYRHPGESDDARLDEEFGRALLKAENVLEKKGETIKILET